MICDVKAAKTFCIGVQPTTSLGSVSLGDPGESQAGRDGERPGARGSWA